MRRKARRKARKPSPLKGLTPGMRMKGGVRFDPAINGFVAIVHIWDNVHAYGEPDEWRAPQVFPTEEEAMAFCKTSIRPALERFMADLTGEKSGGIVHHFSRTVTWSNPRRSCCFG
jgi:hypothetical protein